MSFIPSKHLTCALEPVHKTLHHIHLYFYSSHGSECEDEGCNARSLLSHCKLIMVTLFDGIFLIFLFHILVYFMIHSCQYFNYRILCSLNLLVAETDKIVVDVE